MSSTVKLYDDNPYLNKFRAKVLNIEGNQIELDRTGFYPEGGGQAGDTGFIGGVRVVDTCKKGDVILHLLESVPPFSIGDELECIIDWDRRYRIMKLHSAAHIMEYFLRNRLGEIERLGSNVDDKKDRADYAYEGRLPAEELKLVEVATNNFLAENHDIEILPDPERPGIRIWKCCDIKMPCGGTHVRNTREIGPIKLKRKNPGRGVERVETSLREI